MPQVDERSLDRTAAALPAMSRIARAEAFPSRPITMVVPVSAGGAMDTNARLVAEGMRITLGQAVLIENVTGASGSIGVGRVARAAPDGYTITYAAFVTHVVNPAVGPRDRSPPQIQWEWCLSPAAARSIPVC
jgi:tripartite-type tricarboxylate transporter receptor subunit TctC